MLAHLPILCLVSLLVGALATCGLGLFHQRLAKWVALLTNILFLVLAGWGLKVVMATGPIRYALAGWPPPFGIELVLDPLAAFIVTLIAGISLLVLTYGLRAVEEVSHERVVPFFALALILELGLAGMVLTGDLFNLYVFLEIASLAAYALLSFGGPRAPLAAYRYLLAGAMGGTFYLLGIGYLYFLTGSLNMADIAGQLSALPASPALTVAVLLMVTGFGLKMALFPMHRWLPDAYAYAQPTATALIAPLMTKVSATVLIRFFFFVFAGHEIILNGVITEVIAWLSAAGIVVGAVMAMAQRDLKRMLAYSSVSQIGYIGLGIGMATPLALIGALLHILNHAVMKGTLFLAAGLFERGQAPITVEKLSGLGQKLPSASAAYTVAALAMVGFPPTVGFFSKWYLVWAGIEAHRWVFVVVIIASSLLTAVYLFRTLEMIYLAKGERVASTGPAPWLMNLPTLLLATISLFLGLGSMWLVNHLFAGIVGYV